MYVLEATPTRLILFHASELRGNWATGYLESVGVGRVAHCNNTSNKTRLVLGEKRRVLIVVGG